MAKYEDKYSVKDSNPPLGPLVWLANIVMWIAMTILVWLGIIWYFRQDKATKRKVWLVLIIFGIVGWIWQDVILEILGGMPAEDEMKKLQMEMRERNKY